MGAVQKPTLDVFGVGEIWEPEPKRRGDTFRTESIRLHLNLGPRDAGES